MKAPAKILLAVLVTAGLSLGGFVVFEHFDRQGLVKAGERACSSLDTPSGTSTLPAGFTLPNGQELLRVESQGKTSLVVASIAGRRSDVVTVRDRVLADLTAVGFTETGKDQEPGYEAEAELGGVGTGTLKVRPLCAGRLEVRYTLRG